MPMRAKTERKQAIQDDPDVFWMIRDKNTGQFSHGGTYYIHWSKTGGKVWSTHKRLLAHLSRVESNHERKCFGPSYWRMTAAEKEEKKNNPLPPHPYENAEIIQFRRTREASIDAMEYGK